MCYLPGSEGKGISDVLCGCADFTGRLPSPWYGSVEQIGTEECAFEFGYGLSYSEGFKLKAEPTATYDPPAAPGTPDAAIVWFILALLFGVCFVVSLRITRSKQKRKTRQV